MIYLVSQMFGILVVTSLLSFGLFYFLRKKRIFLSFRNLINQNTNNKIELDLDKYLDGMEARIKAEIMEQVITKLEKTKTLENSPNQSNPVVVSHSNSVINETVNLLVLEYLERLNSKIGKMKDIEQPARVAETPVPQRTELHPNITSATPPSHEDNLMLLRGIGPFINKVLKEKFGIHTFLQIATLTNDEILAIEKQIFFKGIFKRCRWVEKAKDLHNQLHPEPNQHGQDGRKAA